MEVDGASTSKLDIPVDPIYKDYANGGVFIFKIMDKEQQKPEIQ